MCQFDKMSILRLRAPCRIYKCEGDSLLIFDLTLGKQKTIPAQCVPNVLQEKGKKKKPWEVIDNFSFLSQMFVEKPTTDWLSWEKSRRKDHWNITQFWGAKKQAEENGMHTICYTSTSHIRLQYPPSTGQGPQDFKFTNSSILRLDLNLPTCPDLFLFIMK